MIYTHLPTKSAWQMLPVPVTTLLFKSMPQLKGRFVFNIEIPRADKLEVFAREPKRNHYSGLLNYRVAPRR